MFLIQEDGQLVEMSEQPYPSEDMLQELLAKYHNLLPGDQINDSNPRRWLLISREASLPSEENGPGRWSVDHLFLDQDATPTLVEVKRSSNTDIRRKIVGQMLDYAANAVVYWPIDEIRSMFEATCSKQGVDPQEKLEDFLDANDDPDSFWQKARTNLQGGKIRMLFVADEIPAELRRIVEFLNSQMDRAEVLAVEIKQFIGQNQRSLVPRVIGQTEEATTKKIIRAGKQWDAESFFQDLELKRGHEEVEIAREIMKRVEGKLPISWWGRGNNNGSFFPILDHKGISYYPISIWSNGKVVIQFQHLKKKPPFDSESKRRELMDRLNRIPGFSISEDALGRRPGVYLSIFKNEYEIQQFLETLDWAVQEIKRS